MNEPMRRFCTGAATLSLLACSACWRPVFLPPLPPTRIAPEEKPPAPLPSGEGRVRDTIPGAAPSPAPKTPLTLRVESAILMALANNQSLRVETLNPAILQTFEDQASAVFDPVLAALLEASRTRTRSRTGTPPRWTSATASDLSAEASIEQFFPTGTTVSLGANTDASRGGSRMETTRLGLSVTQALLQGYGLDVNLAAVRQARLDTLVSHYELRGFAEALIASVEETYWDYALAERQIGIFSDSLKIAEQQLAETQERISIGKLAGTELAAAQAEVASRREALINARSALATTRLQFLRLLNPPGLWQREVVLEVQPTAPDVKLDAVEAHTQVALRMRPDLNQARLSILHGDLEVVKTRNGLLPRLDLFLTLGKTGYATTWLHSYGDLGGKGYDAAAGLTYEFPLGNRDARAAHGRATLSRRQLDEALGNLAQLAEVDVRSAYVEVERAREQVVATAATRTFREEAVRAETEKFRVGKSTTLLVAQAQRDLVVSQIAEVQAVATLLKDLVELYRLDGTLLERRGIAAPGREPVDLGAGVPGVVPPTK